MDATSAGCVERRAGMKDHPSIVMGNKRKTDSLWVMTLRAPELARAIRPGQFVHMEMPTLQSNILRRPFSIYDVDEAAGTVDILYQVVGVGTADMTKWEPGYLTNMIGPIGSAWTPPADAKRALLVGGGVGAAPLFLLYKELVRGGVEADVILGAVTKEALVCHERYASVCACEPRCSTDDGTFGRQGFCTVLVEEALDEAAAASTPYDYVAVCGPEPLMRAVVGQVEGRGASTQVSLEKRMACGIGACLSCVVDTHAGKRRACVDGPIFDAEEVIW